MDNQAYTRHMARFLRAAVIKNLVHSKEITRDDALKLLNAPLNPNDPSTMSDDRYLLDVSDRQFLDEMDSVKPA